jgi:outer membrane immunogenic protein
LLFSNSAVLRQDYSQTKDVWVYECFKLIQSWEASLKKIIGLVGVALLVTGPAFADDLAVKAPVRAPFVPAFNWTGFYVGVNGGYGWNQSTGDAFCTTPAGLVSGPGCSVPVTGTLKPQGGIFGGQAGYNFQNGNFVWGVETDIQWSGIKDSATVGTLCCLPVPVPNGSLATSQSLEWFGTLRGRLGITVLDRGLLYGTGGLIYGEEKASATLTFPTGVTFGPGGVSSTHAGWTAGGGLEYAFTNNWTGKIEGLYYDMGSQTVVLTSRANAFTESATFNYKGALVRAGLNWKF